MNQCASETLEVTIICVLVMKNGLQISKGNCASIIELLEAPSFPLHPSRDICLMTFIVLASIPRTSVTIEEITPVVLTQEMLATCMIDNFNCKLDDETMQGDKSNRLIMDSQPLLCLHGYVRNNHEFHML